MWASMKFLPKFGLTFKSQRFRGKFTAAAVQTTSKITRKKTPRAKQALC